MTFPLIDIAIKGSSRDSLTKQLYDQLRAIILSGTVASGTRLPSSRDLSEQLGLSRNTVMTAYEQLVAEAYLESRVGAGTFVVQDLPDAFLRTQHQPSSDPQPATKRPRKSRRKLSERGNILASASFGLRDHFKRPRAFQTGLPDIHSFPSKLWAQMTSRRYRDHVDNLLQSPAPAGYIPLREEIVNYLSTTRGVRCTPEQVIIVNGSQQALDLAARILLNVGDEACVEDPGYLGTLAAIRGSGAVALPIPINEEGFDVDTARKRAPYAKLISVTPSRQYPLGITMSLVRRLELLNWASEIDAWILEDDYDSEYRYKGLPLAALQGLDNEGRVIYIGTFSKLMFPSLRLGYMVVPLEFVESFTAAHAVTDRGSSWLHQSVMAEFIAEGHFTRHIRKMRTLYAQRQAALVNAAERHLDGILDVQPEDAGMHVIGRLPERWDDVLASELVAKAGIEAEPLSRSAIESTHHQGLLLGYTGVTEPEIEEAARTMAQALRKLRES
ncbi:MAG: PLP-dependent aminotransferase family protein [Chloroflexi bacterium]|nr:PLP-dependent aminotransferase family protein [Chloroflexota bacterium]